MLMPSPEILGLFGFSAALACLAPLLSRLSQWSVGRGRPFQRLNRIGRLLATGSIEVAACATAAIAAQKWLGQDALDGIPRLIDTLAPIVFLLFWITLAVGTFTGWTSEDIPDFYR